MKVHKLSKKNAKVISMELVRYEQTSLHGTKEDEAPTVQSNEEIEPLVRSQSSDENILTCILCKLKVSNKEKLSSHMTNRHAVTGSKLSDFISGESSSVLNGPNDPEDRNKCKICNEDFDNLGKLWNHYK